MASAVDTQCLKSRTVLGMFDHDPGAATAKVTSADGGTTEQWYATKDIYEFAAAAMLTDAGTAGAITKVEIVAAPTADETDTDLVVVKDSGVIAADAVGDWAIEECTIEEIAQLESDNAVELNYVAARLTLSAADAEAAVTYLATPRHQYADRTPETTIA